MEKKRVVTSMEKISPEIKDLIIEQYPYGWKDSVIRINKPTGEFFHAIRIETSDSIYLIKVQVKVDNKSDLDKEDEKGYSNSGDGDDDDGGDDSYDGSEEPADEE